MKKIKRYTITSLCSLILGTVLFAFGFCMAGCDFKKLDNVKAEMLTYTETAGANIHTVEIDYNTTDINVVFGDEFKIEYPKRYKKGTGKAISKITLTEENGVLSLEEVSSVSFFSLDFDHYSLTLTLPLDRTFALDLETSTGDISLVDGGRYTSLSLETTTGDIIVGQSECATKLDAEVSTGDIKISNFTGTHISAEATTGDITLNNSTVSDTISLETTTGKIKTNGTIVCSSFKAKSTTGSIRIKDVLDATTVYVKASTGDVTLYLIGDRATYKTELSTTTGEKNISNNYSGERVLTIKTTTGDITVHFVAQE